MTWSAQFHVDNVTAEHGVVSVYASTTEVTSNTEGNIKQAELWFQIDADHTALKVGDMLPTSGDFHGA